MKMLECYRGEVHPWLCDAMGHMTMRHYVAMFDDAGYHLLAAIGYCAEQLEQGYGVADRKHTISFQAELRAGALLLIRCGIVKVGTRSLTALYRMEELHTRATAAEMEVVMVQFDLRARQAVPLLDAIRTGAQALL